MSRRSSSTPAQPEASAAPRRRAILALVARVVHVSVHHARSQQPNRRPALRRWRATRCARAKEPPTRAGLRRNAQLEQRHRAATSGVALDDADALLGGLRRKGEVALLAGRAPRGEERGGAAVGVEYAHAKRQRLAQRALAPVVPVRRAPARVDGTRL